MSLLNISIETLLVVLVLGHILTGALIIAYTARRERSSAANTFLLSKLLQLVSWALIGSRKLMPGMFLIAFANSVLFTGAALELIAFMRLKNCCTPRIKKAYVALLVGCILTFVSAVALECPENVRITFASTITALLMAYPVYRLFTDPESSILQKTIAIFYGITIIFLLFRAYAAITMVADMNLTSVSVFNTGLFLLFYLDMIAGSTGFILMDREKLDAELEKAASFDGLTNTLNRKAFIERSEKIIPLLAREGKPASFLLMDIDDFKRINDVHGHYSGDDILQNFADIIRNELRNGDLFGRFGGEEFAILLPGADEKEGMEIAERLRAAIESSTVEGNPGICYTVSIGISTAVPGAQTGIATLYKASDQALYAAKVKGKNCVVAWQMGSGPQAVLAG